MSEVDLTPDDVDTNVNALSGQFPQNDPTAWLHAAGLGAVTPLRISTTGAPMPQIRSASPAPRGGGIPASNTLGGSGQGASPAPQSQGSTESPLTVAAGPGGGGGGSGAGASPSSPSSPNMLGGAGLLSEILRDRGTTNPGANATSEQPAAGPTDVSAAANAKTFVPMIQKAAEKYGVDPGLLGKQLFAESLLDPKAESPAGAKGIAQFMPATAKRYGVDVNDPESSINGAAHYFSDLKKMFGGNDGLALAAYNWGEGNVGKWVKGEQGWQAPKETQDYVQRITGKSLQEWKDGKGASEAGVPNVPKGPMAGEGVGNVPTGPMAEDKAQQDAMFKMMLLRSVFPQFAYHPINYDPYSIHRFALEGGF